ncbi:Aste57867_16687 [Aphanomyces stellatus]|uniref:Aste57867_16687 protein n=1 Tax=Aphanomyces stellatus TaxID=120398 RepID=A0A485L784_9STRA|nr:hypothetical protein As57867_016630 [Aphanomyces stellatus]VFT93457.1 Aste57867_16687 [Aphanomyces stellatus]
MLKCNNKQLMLMLRQLKEDAQAQDPTTENIDDLEEEMPPVGVQNDGTHVQIMSVDTIPMFTGDVEGRDAASTWLQRFVETAVSCRWSDDETKRRFKLNVSRPVQDWFNQLRKEQKATWKATRARFVKEYVLSPIPKEEVYYTMEQRTDESDKAYLFRFNAAARAIRQDYHSSRRVLRLHINRFAHALRNKSFGTILSQHVFNTMDELEEYLDLQRQNDAMKMFKNKSSTAPAVPPSECLYPRKEL